MFPVMFEPALNAPILTQFSQNVNLILLITSYIQGIRREAIEDGKNNHHSVQQSARPVSRGAEKQNQHVAEGQESYSYSIADR